MLKIDISYTNKNDFKNTFDKFFKIYDSENFDIETNPPYDGLVFLS